jgi:hypothetical protein
MKLAIIAAAVLGAPLLAARAGVDEPPAPREAVWHTAPSTALDDSGVRPLNGSRNPIPAIEHDIVEPQPHPTRRTRSADDELVRPVAPMFYPERSLDDSLALPRGQHGSAAAGRSQRDAAEDPAGRASEAGKPTREGKAER